MIPLPSQAELGGSISARATGGRTHDDGAGRGRQTTGARNQIGALKLKGWPLAVKFSLAISLLVVISLSIFGWISIGTVETGKYDDIVRSGYDDLQGLKYFAQQVVNDNRNEKNDAEFKKKLDAYREFILDLLKKDPRVYDIAIFVTEKNKPDENPSMGLVQGREAKGILPPNRSKRTLSVNLPGADPEVLVYEGDYKVVNAKVEHVEQCLYFRMPIRGGAEDKDPKKMLASLNLIMSAQGIHDEVSALKSKLFMLGVLLAALGVGIALGLAYVTANPIRALVKDMHEVAAGNFDHESAVASTSHDEVGLLASAFNQMTASLRTGRDSELENQRISGELNTAKSIHIKLMPEKLPQLPGIDIFTAYQSAKEVGGDYYDFIPIGDADHLALCVADVSGKGIPGSMVMGTTRTILRMMAVGNLSPADVLSKTNYHVARDIKRGMFVTCVYCILNVRTREMTVASAGHNPMLVHRASTGKIERIRPNGIALGFDKGPVFNRTIREECIQLHVGDRVVLYTDGVVEAMNEARDEFTDEAFEAFILEQAAASSKDFVRLLIKRLDEHKGEAEQHDDITVTTFRVMS